MQFITRPLEKWSRQETRNRKASPYSVGYARTLNDLEREVMHLQVKGDVVIQMDISEEHISRNGTPYSNARPRSPRVAVAFTSQKYGPMTYSCDKFCDWADNIRAIALGMQRLRLVEETGIISRGEQYTGFRALPSGIEVGPATMTVEEAAMLLSDLAGIPDRWQPMIAAVDTFRTVYRAAALKHHPDAKGTPTKWAQVNAAAEVLKKHHSIS
jgi:hypothetical protein